MKGRRIHHVVGADPYHELSEPGDYVLVTEAPYAYDGRPSIYFITPEAFLGEIDDSLVDKIKRIAGVASPPHIFRECADGSIEVRESILVTAHWNGEEKSWHGYLDEGHNWRTV